MGPVPPLPPHGGPPVTSGSNTPCPTAALPLLGALPGGTEKKVKKSAGNNKKKLIIIKHHSGAKSWEGQIPVPLLKAALRGWGNEGVTPPSPK